MRLIASLLTISALCAAGDWHLNEPTSIPAATREYQLSEDYKFSNPEGQLQKIESVNGTYTLTMPNGSGTWRDVTIREGSNPPTKLDYMEGLRCTNKWAEVFRPDFFKHFPAQSLEGRNMIWDTVMFLQFASTPFRSLQLNQPFTIVQNKGVDLAGSGTFTNKDLTLTWDGYSERNRRRCALMTYQANFNPLLIKQPGGELKGRSRYWGQLWIALATRQIEYGTLYEDVLLQVPFDNGSMPHVVNIFRACVLSPKMEAAQ